MFVHSYFSIVRLVLACPRKSFGLTKTSVHSNICLVLAYPRSSFGLAESSSLNDYFCTNARTGLHCPFLWAHRDIFAWQHMAFLGPPKELIKIKSRTPSSPPLGQPGHLCKALKTCLGLSKELVIPHEGPCHQPLRANRDVFTSRHVNSHGPPKDMIEATSKIYFSLAN
jgi:hypothetical protein